MGPCMYVRAKCQMQWQYSSGDTVTYKLRSEPLTTAVHLCNILHMQYSPVAHSHDKSSSPEPVGRWWRNINSQCADDTAQFDVQHKPGV